MWGFECPRGKAPRLTFKGSRGISHDRPAEPVHETFSCSAGALLREKLRQGGVVGSSFASSTGVIDPTEAARLAATFGNIRRHTRVTRS